MVAMQCVLGRVLKDLGFTLGAPRINHQEVLGKVLCSSRQFVKI